MKISDLIAHLEKLKEEHGDLPIYTRCGFYPYVLSKSNLEFAPGFKTRDVTRTEFVNIPDRIEIELD